MNYIKLVKAIGILVLWIISCWLALIVLVKWPWIWVVAALLCLVSVMVAVIYNELD